MQVLAHRSDTVKPMENEIHNLENQNHLRQRLTAIQYHCTQESGTEPAFTGEYWDEKRSGLYRCIVCREALFDSTTKYDSGSGWPSFWQPISGDLLNRQVDSSRGMVRTELTCASCEAHLGHVFLDGPQPTGERHCINSACLTFETSS